MTELFSRLYVGSLQDCQTQHDGLGNDGFAILHASKSPCHTEAVGYKGKLARDNPYYLIFKRADNLYLNMIDAPFPLLPEFGNPMFEASMKFIDYHLAVPGRKVLVHCNKGNSRGPSIVMAYAARKALLNALTFKSARVDFLNYFPLYMPGDGIAHYLENNWNTVMSF